MNLHPLFAEICAAIAPKPEPHDCVNYIDVRFHGADDHEGETYCVKCQKSYTAEELSDMHAALYATDERKDAAA